MAVDQSVAAIGYQVSAYIVELGIGDFDSISGGQAQKTITNIWVGGINMPIPSSNGTAEVAELTLKRNYIAARDGILKDLYLKSQAGLAPLLTVVKTQTSPSGQVTEMCKYLGCVVKDFEFPDGTAGSNDVAQITITLKPTSIG